MSQFDGMTKQELIGELEALRSSEEQLRVLVERTRDIPFSLDAEGRIRYLGPQAARYGIDPLEAMGMEFLGLIAPGDRERVEKDWQRTMITGEEFPMELSIVGPDGSRYWFAEHGTPLRDDAGELVGIVGTLRDITEQRRVEGELQATQRSYSDFMNVSHDPIVHWQMPKGLKTDLPIEEQVEMLSQGICIDASRAFWEAVEVDGKAEVVGKGYSDLVPGRPYDDAAAAFIRNGYRLVDFEAGSVSPSGTEYVGLETWHGVVEDGELTQLWTISKNITALKESERRFRTLFDQASEFSAVLDPTGTVKMVNNAVRNLLVASQTSVIETPFWEMPWWSTPELRAHVREAVSRAAEGEVVRWESDDIDREGEHRIVDALISPILNESGEVVLLLALGRDNTDLKHAENTLKESEERYRTLVEHAPEAITMIDCETGAYADVNQRACELFQLGKDELFATTPAELSPPLQPNGRSSVEMAEELLRQAVSGGTPNFEWLHRDSQGKEIPCEVSLVRLPSSKGTFVRGAIFDITKRKRAEEALRESEERLRLATRAGKIGVWEYDLTTGRFSWDDTVQEIYGMESPDLEGGLDTWTKRLHPDDFAPAQEGFRLFLEDTGRPYDERFRIIRENDGQVRVIRGMAGLTRNAEGVPVRALGTNQDITEQVRMESQLVQAQKMEAIGTLAGGIAHDFNNILSAIGGYTELSLDGLGRGKDVTGDLTQVLTASERAADLVSQILTFSRQTEAERRPIHLQPTIKEAVKLLRASIPATIEMQSHVASECRPVIADPTQIHQVVMNLCTNAYQAMRDSGGVLGIKLEELDVGPEEAALHVDLQPGRYALLAVSDTGFGIDSVTQSRLFEPYFTTKEKGEGTGLGLAVVHSIVEGSGGAITVESEPGRGATFRLFFPVAMVSDEDRGAKGADGKPHGHERVLFVDDEAPVCEVARRSLTRFGYDVTTVRTPAGALDIFRETPDAFDVVVTDLTMPGMSGLELAKAVHDLRPKLPIVLVSGFLQTRHVDQGRLSGIREVLSKPVSGTGLGWAIRRALSEDGQD